jgi:dienelactone hydrolase
MLRCCFALVACLATLGLSLPAAAARIVAPASIILGDPAGIVVRDAAPGERLRVHAFRRTAIVAFENGARVERPVVVHAWAEFMADEAGQVAIDRAVPIAGTYAGADWNGLLWSGWPLGDARLAEAAGAAVAATIVPDAATLMLRLERAGVTEAPVAVRLRSYSERVQFTELNVAGDGVSGVFAAPAGGVRLPTVILLHGSEGGSQTGARAWAGRMAERGFAALALNYVAYSWGGGIAGVPDTFINLPVEVLDRARLWLAGRPDADSSRIALLGASKGAELALVAAGYHDWVRATVACVPSDIIWSGYGRAAAPGERISSWSWAGQPLPYVAYDRYEDVFAGRATAAEVHVRSRIAAGADSVAAARIPVDRIAGHVLLLGAGRDQVWPSLGMARNIREAYRAAGRARLLQVEEYPEAGHNICGTGATPEREDGNDGGPTAIAAGAAFRATLAFLRERLR